ncbi:glycopeptide antibiotics resistance protein [Leifsonia psychrotolerans]|uniref:Glycopeptide antibiotics resistance protein n=1 Tax=Glaciibacter psychrotolerans TaxID=670054 RepID=A0A7Z0EFE1_9MICO|nr:glycopeptide antibiotics resistance protein [Leifsonia psychrotolerans]
MRRHPLLLTLTLAYLAVIGVITLGPQPLDPDSTSGLRLLIDHISNTPFTAWISYSLVEFLANIAMFAPLGLLIALLSGARRWWAAILFGFAVSCMIEFSQLFLPTRVSDLRDIIANTLGTALGVGIAWLITQHMHAHSGVMRKRE